MNPTLVIRVLTLKALPVYTCHNCGAKEYGDTVRRELSLDCSPSELSASVEHLEQEVGSHHMPVGWLSQWAPKHNQYLCPNCHVSAKP